MKARDQNNTQQKVHRYSVIIPVLLAFGMMLFGCCMLMQFRQRQTYIPDSVHEWRILYTLEAGIRDLNASERRLIYGWIPLVCGSFSLIPALRAHVMLPESRPDFDVQRFRRRIRRSVIYNLICIAVVVLYRIL